MTTPNLIILTPSRGRPERFRALCQAVEETTQGRAGVIGAVDLDDPTLDQYIELDEPYGLATGPRNTLSGWTNDLARDVLSWPNPPAYLASLGDDHLPRTKHWDKKLIAAIKRLDGPGWAYGHDKYQGVNLPTAWVVSIEIVRALGWVMLPTCKHMFVDDVVRDLGDATGRLAFVPQVVIEHMHPVAGKAERDETYEATNNARAMSEDRAAYRHWRRGQIRRDMAKVLGVTW